ncbi:MAG: hypothetical protein K8H88_25800, partial [Sandaracinaceae bacterium]|nr:hypothetical protein [Sandaracinaceae bacterium]
QWALDRMWEGLMAPADDRFIAGAGALAEAPLHPSAIAPNQTVPENVRAISDRTHTLGSNASRATEPVQRAQLYGELLTTCNGCHSQLEGAPSP